MIIAKSLVMILGKKRLYDIMLKNIVMILA